MGWVNRCGPGNCNSFVEATRVGEGAGRASVSITLSLSNNGIGVEANVNFFSRVLATFTIRNNFNLRIFIRNSLSISARRAIRSANVTLNTTFGGTLNSVNNVGHCNSFCVPVSRDLTLYTLSVSGEPFLIFGTRFGRRHYNRCRAYYARRFFHTFTIGTNVALRLGILCNDGSRRRVRTLFGTFTRTVGVTITPSNNKILSAGNIL